MRPAPFSAFTTPEFWNDPHISGRMLTEHLDPEAPLASRPHAFIDRSVAWLIPALRLTSGSRVLDLGCGPGLYARPLAERGIAVLGIDVSARALDHARTSTAGLPAEFRQGSYLDTDLGRDHDAALLIFEDYCALSPAQRGQLLTRVRAALRTGGRLLFDVTAAPRFAEFSESTTTAPDLMDGFWADTPYTGTHQRWTYPEQCLVLDHFTIETADRTRQFWNWMQCLTPSQVTDELAAADFTVTEVLGDVAGGDYDPQAPVFAVVAEAV